MALGEIHGNRVCAGKAAAYQQREVAGAAGQIEYTGAGRKSKPVHAGTLPAAIHAIGKSAGDEIVTRGDGVEHRLHQIQALLFRRGCNGLSQELAL